MDSKDHRLTQNLTFSTQKFITNPRNQNEVILQNKKVAQKKHSLFACYLLSMKETYKIFRWRHWLIQIGVSFLYGLRHSPNRSGFKYVFSVWNIDFLGISWGCFLVMGLIFFGILGAYLVAQKITKSPIKSPRIKINPITNKPSRKIKINKYPETLNRWFQNYDANPAFQ